jgi:predicted RNase H-like HicB family nuclease
MSRKKSQDIHLPILVEQDENNYFIVSCPVYKGCHSYGKSIDEALDNIREVIEMCMEEKREKGMEGNRFIGFREIKISKEDRVV